MQFLIDFLQSILTWLFGLVTWALQQCWNLVLLGLAAVLNALPVPSWLSSAPSVFAAMPDSMAYFGSVFQVSNGVQIMLSAYVIRFVIRRLPLIG